MNVDDFFFHLPEDLIASHPAPERAASRLLVVRPPADAPLLHRHFADVGEFLRAGDLLVMNDSRVIPARLLGRRATGGAVEVLLLECEAPGQEPVWRALLRPAKKIAVGESFELGGGAILAEVLATHEGGERSLRLRAGGVFDEVLHRVGRIPLPPYILKRREVETGRRGEDLYEAADAERYQTVYAREEGSVAAPTAGLHFTPELLAELRAAGIGTAFVTLHVGAGTFRGMEEGTRVEDHRMHEEWWRVPAETADAVARTRAAGGRVVVVGTTAVRTVESAWDDATGRLRVGSGRTSIMIAPGHRFRCVDALITNFHLPRSTLMLLVSAFIGRERILAAYAEAIAQRYRFFSYGDAMLLLPA